MCIPSESHPDFEFKVRVKKKKQPSSSLVSQAECYSNKKNKIQKMIVGYHGSSKMAVVATAALLSLSITAPLAVLQFGAFTYCRTFGDTFPAG